MIYFPNKVVYISILYKRRPTFQLEDYFKMFPRFTCCWPWPWVEGKKLTRSSPTFPLKLYKFSQEDHGLISGWNKYRTILLCITGKLHDHGREIITVYPTGIGYSFWNACHVSGSELLALPWDEILFILMLDLGCQFPSPGYELASGNPSILLLFLEKKSTAHPAVYQRTVVYDGICVVVQ